MKKTAILIGIILLSLFSGYAQEARHTISLACSGTSCEFDSRRVHQVRRIVSLASSITKNLYLLGAQGRIVGCTRYCETDPADSIPVIADAVNVNLEQVLQLRPDIVLASGLTHPRILEGLKRLGIHTLRLNQPTHFEDICQQLEQLGELSGKKELAMQINRECRERLQKVQERIPEGKRPTVFFQLGADPLFTALPNTFMDDYIRLSGGINLASGLNNGMVSKEFVLLKNPDVIFITAMGLLTQAQKKEWQKITALTAVKKDRIFLLDDSVCSPTPIIFVETVEEMARLMSF